MAGKEDAQSVARPDSRNDHGALPTGEVALRALLDALQDPMVVLRAVRDERNEVVDFVYAEANQTACDFEGVPHDELVGMRLLDQHPAASADGRVDLYARIIESGEPLAIDDWAYPQELPGDEPRYYDLRATRFGDGVVQELRDVTDRYATRTALAQSEARLQMILDNADEGINLLDLATGRYEFMSPAQAAMTGFTMEELNGISVEEALERCHPDDRHVSADQQRQIRAGQDVITTEVRWRIKSGEYRWFRDRRRVLRDERGEPSALVGVTTDITETVEAREALARSEERYRLVAENAADAVCYVDEAGLVRWVTPSLGRLTGWEPGDLSGRPLGDILNPQDRARVDVERASLPPGTPMTYLARVRTRSGTEVWVSVTDKDVRDAGGTLIGRVFGLRDVNAEVAAREQLAESERNFRILFETMSQGVVFQGADGTITAANPAAARILGLSLDQLYGRTSQDPRWRALREDGGDFTGEEHPAMVALRTGNPVTGTVMGVYHPESDETRWIRIDAFPQVRGGEDRPYQVFTVFKDITEIRAAENAVLASEERYRIAIDGTYDWEWWEAPDGSFVYSSPACEAVTGYGPEEFAEGPDRLLSIAHRDDRDRLREHLAEDVDEESGPSSLEFRITARDGSERVIEHRCKPVFGDDGAHLGRRGSNRDVTERVRGEEELRALRITRDRAEAVAHVGSWSWDPASRRLTVSPETYRLLDVEPGEAAAEDLETLTARVHPDDRRSVLDAMDAAIELGRPAKLEFRVVRKDGAERTLVAEARVESDTAGTPVALVGYCQDVT